jgi:hypothetical protein
MEEIKQVVLEQKKEKLESAFDNLENSIKLWWKNFKVFLAVYFKALFYPVIAFLASVLIGLISKYFFPNQVLLETFVVALFIVAIILGIYFFARAFMAITTMAKDDYQGSPEKAFADTKNLFWPYILLSILSTILIILWTLLLIVPGIIYSILYSFAVFVFLFENKRGMAALKRSKELVKGYFWPVFGRSIVIGIFMSIIMGVLSIPLEFFAENTLAFGIFNVVYNVVAFLIVPISIIFSYRIYKDLVRIKDVK